MKQHVRTFLIWAAALNWPPALMLIPFFKLLAFIPALFWINIPVLWLGLAELIGEAHYGIGRFGAMPLTPLAWILIAAFWVVAAVVLTMLTALFRGRLCGN